MKIVNKQDALIKTARRLFAENGFYGTATARIAKEAGVSNGMLFHFFTSKEKLIQLMFDDLKNRLFTYSLEQFYRDATTKESIYTLWLAAIEWNLENQEDFAFAKQIEVSPPKLQINHHNRHFQLFEEILIKGKKNQFITEVPNIILYKLFTAHIAVSVDYLIDFPDLQNNIVFKDTQFEILWNSMRKN